MSNMLNSVNWWIVMRSDRMPCGAIKISALCYIKSYHWNLLRWKGMDAKWGILHFSKCYFFYSIISLDMLQFGIYALKGWNSLRAIFATHISCNIYVKTFDYVHYSDRTSNIEESNILSIPSSKHSVLCAFVQWLNATISFWNRCVSICLFSASFPVVNTCIR